MPEDLSTPTPIDLSPLIKKAVHDLNGELFLIRGYVEITLKLVESDNTASDNLTKVLNRADELEKVIESLKAITMESTDPTNQA